ncbi:hypothetical protein CEK62_16340 [Alcanivorax sp. N3-2A]|nr:hypothetical protein CEK62_16340 [Alcanivorax sp. N3-2A]
MPLYLLIALLVLVLLITLIRWRRRRGAAAATALYQRRDTLLSRAEWSFYQVLRRAVAEQGLVMAKVRIADVLTPTEQRDRGQWWRLFNRISAKHFDFLICSADDSRPLVAVELDDGSHQNPRTRERDQLVESAARDAGLPLIRVPARTGYAMQQIREMLMMHLPALPSGAPLPTTDTPTPEPEPEPERGPSPLVDAEPTRACPTCGARMTQRNVRHASGSDRFWVCGRYPACRTARPA